MFTLLFDPRGAIPRLPFFLGLIASFVVLSLSLGVMLLPGYLLTYATPTTTTISMAVYILSMLCALISVWISLCVHLKRLYDLNVTRLLIILPFIAAIANKYIPNSPQARIMHVVILVYVAALIFWPTRRKI